MIIIRCIVNWLIRKGTISSYDRELYEYAGYSLFISLLPVIIIMIMGILMGEFIESILIILPFMCIRKFSGGFHLKYAWLCMIFSCSILYICVCIIVHIKFGFYINIGLMCAIMSLILLSPIDSENRRLEISEIERYRKITIIMSIIFLLVYLIFIFIRCEKYAMCIAEGLILTAILQLPCLLKKHN